MEDLCELLRGLLADGSLVSFHVRHMLLCYSQLLGKLFLCHAYKLPVEAEIAPRGLAALEIFEEIKLRGINELFSLIIHDGDILLAVLPLDVIEDILWDASLNPEPLSMGLIHDYQHSTPL